MKKIECIIRPNKLEEVKESLNELGVTGLTVTQVMGCGLQKGHTTVYRGQPINMNLIPKVKLELVVKDDLLDGALDVICKNAKTGEVGDGKIFVYDVIDVIRIRTGEKGDSAL